MAIVWRGHAALGLVKAIAVGGAAAAIVVPFLRFVVDQAAAGTDPTILWLALAVIVPLILTFVGWMVRDSGNLRELSGAFKTTKLLVEKIDDGQERIFRELGASEAHREALGQRLDRMDDDIKQGDTFRHDLRDELSPKILNSQLAAMERIDKLEERVRLLEMTGGRGKR